MGKRESYESGTFSWAELATPDAKGAKEFYGRVLGWDYDDNDMGEGGVYSMATVDGSTVAALFQTDAPPRWNSYVTVDDVDAAAEKARELGAEILQEPFDVMEAGRMASVQDPTGALVNLWQAKDHIGATLVNAPGALTWNDLMTTDVGKASEFYCELLGWEVGQAEDAPDDRLMIRNGERSNGGMAKLPDAADQAPPHWLPYFAVEDAERAAEAAKEAGGEVIGGPMEVPQGKFAVLADPQGGVFAVFAGEFED